ncbi:signal peptide peptidase SppA [Planctomycetota bacterium]
MEYDPENLDESLRAVPVNPTIVTPTKKRKGWRIFWTIVTCLSVLFNGILFLMLIGLFAIFATGHRTVLTEQVIQAGERTNKIAVINLDGMITGEKAQDIYSQIKAATDDKNVKALILRINSPGGTVFASDEIYHEILRYREKTQKPVVSFMRGVAASGGYYAAVASDKIIAEPTAITGSIGVIMGYMVVQELLEGKLGIEPVVVKSGEKKDWPSSFRPPSPEQLKYLEDKLITPAYERFVKVIADGRDKLSIDDVKRLGDGSIYWSAEALEENLIDQIGYLDDAVKLVSDMAGIEKPHVIEYRKPFSLTGLLGAKSKSLLNIDRNTIYEMSTPELLYLWSSY